VSHSDIEVTFLPSVSIRHGQHWLSCPVSHSDMDSNDFPVQCLIPTFAEVTFLSIVSFRHLQKWLSCPLSHSDMNSDYPVQCLISTFAIMRLQLHCRTWLTSSRSPHFQSYKFTFCPDPWDVYLLTGVTRWGSLLRHWYKPEGGGLDSWCGNRDFSWT